MFSLCPPRGGGGGGTQSNLVGEYPIQPDKGVPNPAQWGYPIEPDGVPPGRQQHSKYLLRGGRMPLAFTQEDFLVISNFYYLIQCNKFFDGVKLQIQEFQSLFPSKKSVLS